MSIAPPAIHAMRLACEDTFLPYLRQVLEQNPPERHAGIKEQFAAHMDFLADFCLRGYPGAGGLTVDFIKGLHRAMFPPDYRQEITTRDGHKIWMVPGEFKTVCNNVCDSHMHPGKVNIFLPAEQVPAAMATLVTRINAELADTADRERKRDSILFFVLDLTTIHPFADANGRVACILADLLAIRAGLSAFSLTAIKSADKARLACAVELARDRRDLAPVHSILAMGNKGSIEAGSTQPSIVSTNHNLYQAKPSAYLTYVERSGRKRHVVDHIVPRLQKLRRSKPHLVLADIGGGGGQLLLDLLNAWLQ